MIKTILDANALIMPFQFGINLDLELERVLGNPDVYVPSSVKSELQGLDRKDALKLSEKYKTVKVSKGADDGVLEAAVKIEGVIVTNDKGLKNRARKMGIPVVFLRSRSHLELIGEIL